MVEKPVVILESEEEMVVFNFLLLARIPYTLGCSSRIGVLKRLGVY
jgi:hypothetical protein